MEDESVTATVEIGLAVFFIVVCAAVFWAALDIPPGVFEPLGAAPVPQGVATTIAFLAILMLIATVRRLRREKASASITPRDYRTRPLAALAICALGIIYVALMQTELLSFALATTFFLVTSVGLLARWRPHAVAMAIALGLIMGYGLQYLFTRVFVIDLPLG